MGGSRPVFARSASVGTRRGRQSSSSTERTDRSFSPPTRSITTKSSSWSGRSRSTTTSRRWSTATGRWTLWPPGRSDQRPVAVDHRLEVVVDLERPLQLELFVVMDRVGGENDRSVLSVDEEDCLPRRVPTDADRANTGREPPISPYPTLF